jgi:hypothetical protein
MDLDAKTIAILIVFFGVVVGLIWDWFGDWDREFWEDLDWNDDEEVDGEDKRTKSGEK